MSFAAAESTTLPWTPTHPASGAATIPFITSKRAAHAAEATTTPSKRRYIAEVVNLYPIIMISSSQTALITIHDVKRFLQESLFESSSAARERATSAGNSRAEDVIHIDRRRVPPSSSSQPTPRGDIQWYFVVDSTDALQKYGVDARERVVCVMSTGQAWQLRPYM
ncbi:RNA pol II accessory factor, Cdc73 family-domain-containing protein [Suillus clintonianus]|uniref:RNA pol II accessory factor, Cdc73 family-domain-containing protein n=1 Tax=Suillus clintonianus TaxID=1904413 RepID=UPI001B866EDE|nr:RNA pol II accessory factor, Cdc73 family-domain-containing protein [Suillus clintonianus]KAG2117616.1 RNA pol II accessory factor, Cdc73 family-domain-containing protein [Suillus clintonianus]